MASKAIMVLVAVRFDCKAGHAFVDPVLIALAAIMPPAGRRNLHADDE
jgi:hypothetical protein